MIIKAIFLTLICCISTGHTYAANPENDTFISALENACHIFEAQSNSIRSLITACTIYREIGDLPAFSTNEEIINLSHQLLRHKHLIDKASESLSIIDNLISHYARGSRSGFGAQLTELETTNLELVDRFRTSGTSYFSLIKKECERIQKYETFLEEITPKRSDLLIESLARIAKTIKSFRIL